MLAFCSLLIYAVADERGGSTKTMPVPIFNFVIQLLFIGYVALMAPFGGALY